MGLRKERRGYTADGLALLTGRTRAYGYRYTEAFLSQVARADGEERFTNALASWVTHLWHSTGVTGETERAEQPHALTCYMDGHRKPVYSEVLIPVAFLLRRRYPKYRETLIIYHRYSNILRVRPTVAKF